MDRLPVEGCDKCHLKVAQWKVERVNPAEDSACKMWFDIHLLLQAADDLMRIDSCDIGEARLLLDRLLMQVQRNWHEATTSE